MNLHFNSEVVSFELQKTPRLMRFHKFISWRFRCPQQKLSLGKYLKRKRQLVNNWQLLCNQSERKSNICSQSATRHRELIVILVFAFSWRSCTTLQFHGANSWAMGVIEYVAWCMGVVRDINMTLVKNK